MAFGAGEYLIAFEDWDGGSTLELTLNRVDPSGAFLDHAGLAVPPFTYGGNQWPLVASNGNAFLLTWIAWGNLVDFNLGMAGRVAASGTLLDVPGMELDGGGWSFGGDPIRVISNGQDYLTVFRWGAYGVLAQRISGDGGILDPVPFVIAAPTMGQPVYPQPEASWNGTDYLVTWFDPAGLNARLVAADGTTASPPILVADASWTGPDPYASPVVASNGSDFMIVWQGSVNGGITNDLYAARVSGAGTVLDSPPIMLFLDPLGTQHAIAYDGADYLVAWCLLEVNADGGSRDTIWGARVSPAGNLVDRIPFPIVEDDSPALAPRMAFDSPHHGVIVYQQSADRRQAVPSRFRFLSFAAQGIRCDAGSDCVSGFCSDGVCCDSACGASNPTDCLACSRGAGASVDGVCDVVRADAGVLCANLDCNEPSFCDGTGTTCPNPVPLPDGTSCTVFTPCTVGACSTGVCDAGPVVCAAPPECQMGGSCAPDAGCVYQWMPDGTACSLGLCGSGLCVAIDGGTDGGALDGGADGGAAMGDGGLHREDAGLVDAGGVPDGGPNHDDAGQSDAGGTESLRGGGCGCGANPGLAVWMSLAAVLSFARRRSPRAAS